MHRTSLTRLQIVEAEKVIDFLDMRSNRAADRHLNLRNSERFKYRLRTRIYIPEGCVYSNTPVPQKSLEVVFRDLSAGGVSFIHPGKIEVSKVILCMPAEDGSSVYLNIVLTRCRRISEDWWEYGAQIKSRINSPQ